MYDNFFDWWEAFTDLAYSRNLSIVDTKETIAKDWYDSEELHIEDGIEKYAR